MFKSGDWVWGIAEVPTISPQIYFKGILSCVFLAEVGDYNICVQKDALADDMEEMLKSIYESNTKGEFEMFLLKKENTFATEQEAREVLEVMK